MFCNRTWVVRDFNNTFTEEHGFMIEAIMNDGMNQGYALSPHLVRFAVLDTVEAGMLLWKYLFQQQMLNEFRTQNVSASSPDDAMHLCGQLF